MREDTFSSAICWSFGSGSRFAEGAGVSFGASFASGVAVVVSAAFSSVELVVSEDAG